MIPWVVSMVQGIYLFFINRFIMKPGIVWYTSEPYDTISKFM